jgi:TonB-linked SusC/RagA family outer membrane protein
MKIISKYITRFLAYICISFLWTNLFAQTFQLAGTVLNEYNIPLQDVLITSENGKSEYMTGVDGAYTLIVSDGSRFVSFSSQGYQNRKMVLEENNSGGEVRLSFDPHKTGGNVNLGYFTQSKESFTGSVSTVTGAELSKSPVANLSQTFAGRFTGLTTMEGYAGLDISISTINKLIRGLSTRNGIDPLVIIDGVISPTMQYEYLTPNEIESVSILKDAATTSIYGMQGANGAIVITTKRGFVGKKKVDVYFDQSFQQMTRRPEMVSAAEYTRLRNQAGANDGLGQYSQFSQSETDGFEAGSNPLFPNNDWYNMYIKDFTLMQRAGLNITGGSERIKYFSNVNYVHQAMPFKVTDEPNRSYDPTPNTHGISLRSNLDVKLNDYFSGFMRLSGNILRRQTAQYGNDRIYTSVFSLPPTQYGPLTLSDDENPESGNQIVTSDVENFPTYGMLNRSGYNRVMETNVMAQTGLTLDMSFLTKGLSLSGLMAFKTFTQNMTLTGQNFERYMRTNDYSTLEFVRKGADENTPLVYSKGSVFYYNLDLFAQMDYKRRFGEHSFDAMAYIFYLKMEREATSGAGMLPYKRQSMGVTALYGYRDKYFIKGDWAYSGSEQFHPDHRYVGTPAISAAWLMSKEGFLTGVDWLSLLKLRASYGITANDQLGDARFLYMDYIDSGGNEGLRGNPELSAEKIKKQNYGIDLGLFNSLSFSMDYFVHKVDNMLEGSGGLVPIYQGIPLDYYPKLNSGKMENKGFELEVEYSKHITKDCSVFAGIGFSQHKNKVISVNESPYDEDYAYRYRSEGYSIGQQWGYLIDYSNGNGMFNSEAEKTERNLTYSFGTPRVGDFIYQDLNQDHIINEKDIAPIGHSFLPEQYYNFSGGAVYRNFEFSFMFQGTANASVNISGLGAYENEYQGVFNDIHLNAWTPERYANNEDITYPALSLSRSTNHVANSFFTMDRSYLRLRNAEIAYVLPANIAGKIAAKKIRIALNAQNLFTIDRMKTKYIDPEVANMSLYQPYRVYNIGISLTF